MGLLRVVAVAGVALAVGGCGLPAAFTCENDAQCRLDGQDGVCDPAGVCGFPDAECASGLRYGPNAGDLSGQCTPDGGSPSTTNVTGQATGGATSAGSSGSKGSSTGVEDCGAVGQPCCDGVCGPAGVCVGSSCQPCQAFVGADEDWACALRSDGALFCWGDNSNGQVGVGAPIGATVNVPELVMTNVTSLGIGSFHGCAQDGSNALWCWGDNRDGQVGIADVATPNFAVPQPVGPLPEPVTFAGGGFHTCVNSRDGAVACWGRNANGQIGPGFLDPTTSPTLLTTIDSVASLDSGNAHNCAAGMDGSVWCWGDNAELQLGDMMAGPQSATPVQVMGLPSAVQIACGDFHTCARTMDGGVWCWGTNRRGQLGNGQNNGGSTAIPQQVPLGDAVFIAAGDEHTCAIRESGELWCWGWNEFGQLGNGLSGLFIASPQAVDTLADVQTVDAGRHYTCASTDSGEVFCWGQGNLGQLGTGSNADALVPIRTLFSCSD